MPSAGSLKALLSPDAVYKPDDLLVMNICAGDGWEKLCSFLGVPVLEIPFPYEDREAE